MFNWAIRTPIAKSRVSSGSGGRGGGDGETFVEDYWEDGVLSGYEDIKSNLSLNPGQQAILEQNEEQITSYLFEVGSDYDPDEFLSFLNVELGDKFNALSETFEQFAEDLSDDWDHSTGGDGYGTKKFLGMEF